jgi:uncharacterized protein (TIGR02145 family)
MSHIQATGFYRVFELNAKFGLLYNQFVPLDVRGISPIGYHIASASEYQTLIDYLGGWEIAGGHLKEVGLVHWIASTGNVDNSSGFTGIGGGMRDFNTGEFWSLKEMSMFHTPDVYILNTQNGGLYLDTWDDFGVIGFYSGAVINCQRNGFSLRYIKDDSNDLGSVTDYDNNVYNTIKINNQVWAIQNLKVRHYNNGDSIPEVTDGATWAALTTGALCAYNNDWNNV